MSDSSERDMARAERMGVVVSVGKERRERMFALGTATAAMLAPAAPVLGLPPGDPLPYPLLSSALAWGLTATLLLSAAGLALQVETVRQHLLRRVHAVRATASRSLPSRRSRAGGTNGRVPPRSAAGSPPL